MIILRSTDVLRVTTDSTAPLHVYASYIDTAHADGAPAGISKQITSISTATNTDVLAAPAAANARHCALLTVRNTHASTFNTVTVSVVVSSVAYEMYRISLPPDRTLQYTEKRGFELLT